MRILYIHQYFRTPEEGGCVRSYHLARGLVANGHKVTMITAHPKRSGQADIDGIRVHFLKIGYKNEYGFVKRITAYLLFVIKSRKLVRKLDSKFDLAYVMTTPLTTGLIALHLKSKYSIPYFFEVGDLWPEVPIRIGAIKNIWLQKALYRFEKKCYFEAQKVIALSPAIRNYIESVSPNTRVNVITNIADTDFFQPKLKIQHFNADHPLQVGYFGTFGAANDLQKLIDVARQCQLEDLPVKFTLMGEGAQFLYIKEISHQLTNVTVLPFGNSSEVKKRLEEQDAIYVSFKNLEILNTGSPNKFFDGLAAGKLIILNFGGWIQQLIEKNKAGFSHDPDTPGEFTIQIKAFIDHPELIHSFQKNARALAEKYYSKDLQIKKLLNAISNQQHINISDSEVYILTA